MARGVWGMEGREVQANMRHSKKKTWRRQMLTLPTQKKNNQCRRLRTLTSAADLWTAAGEARWPHTWRLALDLAEAEWEREEEEVRSGGAAATTTTTTTTTPPRLSTPLAAAARLARPTPRRAYAARAALPTALSDGAEAMAAIQARLCGGGGGVCSGSSAAVAALARSPPPPSAPTHALTAAFEDTMRALFKAGLPVCATPALRRTPEYGCVRACVGWWVAAAPAVVVGFARATSARLAGDGGAGRDGGAVVGGAAAVAAFEPADPFHGAAPAALVAWPDTPWRASALALLRDAVSTLPGGGGPGGTSVAARLEVEADRLAGALARLAVDDDGAAEAGAWGDESEGEGEVSDEDDGASAPPPPLLSPGTAAAPHGILRAYGLSPSIFTASASPSPSPVPLPRARSRLGGGSENRRPPQQPPPPRPCLVVPEGVPASHWWWHGRTPEEAAVAMMRGGGGGVRCGGGGGVVGRRAVAGV
jgi:hypothetical protein